MQGIRTTIRPVQTELELRGASTSHAPMRRALDDDARGDDNERKFLTDSVPRSGSASFPQALMLFLLLMGVYRVQFPKSSGNTLLGR